MSCLDVRKQTTCYNKLVLDNYCQKLKRENTTDKDKTRNLLFILQFRLESTHNSTIRNKLRRYKYIYIYIDCFIVA